MGCPFTAHQTDLRIHHTDSFYNYNENDYPLLHLPLIKPIEADCFDGKTPWRVFLTYGLWVPVPNRQDNFHYGYNIEELEKFAVHNGVIMAYSAYLYKGADAYIQDNYFHWFVVIPEKKIAEGFHSEDEFRQYIQTFDIQDPDWQKPDESYEQFKQTGCLKWIPDCN